MDAGRTREPTHCTYTEVSLPRLTQPGTHEHTAIRLAVSATRSIWHGCYSSVIEAMIVHGHILQAPDAKAAAFVASELGTHETG